MCSLPRLAERGTEIGTLSIPVVYGTLPLTLLASSGFAQPSPIARVAARVAGVLCLVHAVPAMCGALDLLIAAVLLLGASERLRPTEAPPPNCLIECSLRAPGSDIRSPSC
jgi:hypothetical protein